MTATKYPKVKVRTYTLWTYDVWGNARDGWEVNDRCKHGTVEIRCKVEVFNHGTDMEFANWEPTDRQLSRAVGGRGLVWEWQDGSYEAKTKRGKPVGCLELERE